MTKSRRKFTAEQKAAIVRRHLKGKESICSIAEELSIQLTQIHQWVATIPWLQEITRIVRILPPLLQNHLFSLEKRGFGGDSDDSLDDSPGSKAAH